MSDPSTLRVEARSYELDAYDHVNIAVFVNWLEHARLALLRERGVTYTSIREDFGVHIMVVNQSITYKAQVRLGDRLTITSRIEKLGTSSVRFAHTIDLDDGPTACEAEVTMVCVGPDRSATPIPDELRRLLA